MSTPIETPQPSTSRFRDSRSAIRFVSDLIHGIHHRERLDASEILRQHPELNNYPKAILNLAYEDYQRCIELGKPFDEKEFLSSYPGFEDKIKELIEVRKFFREYGFLGQEDDISFPEPGEDFCGFELIEELGRGSFARVFLATEIEFGDRFVVVKVCRLRKNETRILAELRHPQIVTVHAIGRDKESDLVAVPMPFVSRATLFDVVWQNQTSFYPLSTGAEILDTIDRINGLDARLEPVGADKSSLKLMQRCSFDRGVLEISLQLAEALAYTHQHGYCHCDVKPSNVLLTPDGRAMLFDFNLASDTKVNPEDPGGTLPYMAPEQLRLMVDKDAPKLIDSRTDVFAFGITIYQTLTGKHPFGAVPKKGTRREIAKHLIERQKDGPRPIRKLNPNVSRSFAETIEQCLSFRPENRPASGKVLAELIAKEKGLFRRTINWVLANRATLIFFAVLFLLMWNAYRWYEYKNNPQGLGDAAYQQESYEVAAAYFDDAYADDEENETLKQKLIDATRLAAHKSYRAEKYRAAEELYQRLIELEPKKPAAHFWAGDARLKQGKTENTSQYFGNAIKYWDGNDPKIESFLYASYGYCLARDLERKRSEFVPLPEKEKKHSQLRELRRLAKSFLSRSLNSQTAIDPNVIEHNLSMVELHWSRSLEDIEGEREIISALDRASQAREMHQHTYFVLSILSRNKTDSTNIDRSLELGPRYDYLLKEKLRIEAIQLSNGIGDLPMILELCDEGLESGLGKADFNSIANISEVLKGHDEFHKILKRALNSKKTTLPSFFINPLSGTTKPLEFAR